jgi:hypothetical protein
MVGARCASPVVVAGLLAVVLLVATWERNTLPAPAQMSPTIMGPPTVQIYSVKDGQRVPVGELSINGFSSDDKDRNCRVYADVNDMTPMREVTAAVHSNGHSGQEDDFSRWIFSYTQDYQLIKKGSNELTAKISCFVPGNPAPLSEWHTVNVTGVDVARPTEREEPTTSEGEIEDGEDEDEE